MTQAEAARRPTPVVHIITQLELGGAQENTLATLAGLNREMFRPILAAGIGGLLDDDARRLEDVEVYFAPSLVREIRPCRDLRAFLELRRFLIGVRRRHGAPVIVHTHSSKAGILGRWAARAAGVEVIIHSIHGFGFHPGQSPPARWALELAEKLTARITGEFIAVSKANLELGRRLGIVLPGRGRLIRSGFNIDDFRRPVRPPEAVRRDLGIPASSPLIGMIACFKPQKAPEDFLLAAARAAAGLPEARFVLVGDGALRPRLEALRKNLGLTERLSMLGWRRDIPDLIHAMDVVVLTSRWEGLPRVLPQAMAAGKPVVATAVDGTPEAVSDGVTGYLCPPGDTAALSRRIIELAADPDKRHLFGEAAKGLVGPFDVRTMVRQQEELYRELLLNLR